ncbi:hypothetical protein PJL18_03910 [Paenarthrobacter nicotinovorans]|nr:hypothetical protein [Paenarthrobacter nicotinovorans]
MRRTFDGVLDARDHRMGLLACTHPLHEVRQDRLGRFRSADGFHNTHERTAVLEWTDQRYAGGQVLYQVPGEVVAPEDTAAFARLRGDGHAVLGVVEDSCSFSALQRDVWFH